MGETVAEKPRAPLDVSAVSRRIIANVEQVIVGKRSQIVQALVAWYCEGHVLLEDVPGVAKTIMARALAKSAGCTFKRIQCTPDLLPTDVSGGSIFNQKSGEFQFRAGPLFAQLVLADEINRATPRTQSALLEAMAEGSVTIDGETHRLKPPFLLIATQNPIDHEGTFPLPEAQLDRFLVKLSLGYPSLEDESQMLDMLKREHPLEKLQPVISAEQLVACQRAVRTVHVDAKIRRYIVEIVHATRAHHDVRLGGSPRASIALYRAAQAVAAIRGRGYVEPDDVKQIVPAVLAHRVILQPESRLQNVSVAEVITDVLDETKVPLIEAPAASPAPGPSEGEGAMRWIIVAAAVLGLALVFDLGLLAYAMYALIATIVVSRKLADAWSGELTATREVSRERVKIGESVAVVTVLENGSRLPVPWLLLEDLLPRRALMYDPPALEVSGRRLQLASFRGRARKTVLYQVKCHRRGYYQLGPLVAETGDVFGLYRRYRLLSHPSFVTALPEVIPLAGFDVASRRPMGEVRMTHRLFEDPTRIAGVRSYQSGDPLNRIHWGATARTAVLQSKVYEPSSVAGVTVVLDFHEASFDPRGEPVRSELAVTAAASIAGAVCEMGQQAGLVTNGRDAADRIRTEGYSHERLPTRRRAQAAGMRERSERLRPLVVPTQRSGAQLMHILQVLARVEKTDGLDFAQLLAETASRLPRSATVIALLTAVTPAAATALAGLRRRGLAVTAIVNVYEEYEFARLAAPLVAERIDVQQLRDRAAIPDVCLKCLLR